MKTMKKTCALLLSALMLAGCGGGGAKEAVTTCSRSVNGMELKATVYAPAENKPVERVTMNFTMDMDTLLEQSGAEGIDSEMMESILTRYEDMLKAGLAAELGISEDDIQIKTDDSTLMMTVDLKDLEALAKAVNVDIDSDSKVFSEVVKNLKDSDFTCE